MLDSSRLRLLILCLGMVHWEIDLLDVLCDPGLLTLGGQGFLVLPLTRHLSMQHALPMKHYRRNAWTPWFWGQVRWWGTGAPWERSPTLCSTCGQHHGASVQSRLAYCPAWGEFWDLWRKSWTDWTQHACQWQKTATSLELCLCARLLIPLSLINAIPTTERHKLRAEVGLF